MDDSEYSVDGIPMRKKSAEYQDVVALIDKYGVKVVLRWAMSGENRYVKSKAKREAKKPVKDQGISLKKLDEGEVKEVMDEALRRMRTKSGS